MAMVSALAASGLGVTIGMLAVPASASSLSVRAPTSSNWPTNGGYYYLQNLDGDSSACLDANLNTLPANGTNVQTWGCNGWGNQTWIFYSHSNMDTSWFTIENYDGGQCLDADANTLPANGTRVQMWGCNGRGNQNGCLLLPATHGTVIQYSLSPAVSSVRAWTATPTRSRLTARGSRCGPATAGQNRDGSSSPSPDCSRS